MARPAAADEWRLRTRADAFLRPLDILRGRRFVNPLGSHTTTMSPFCTRNGQTSDRQIRMMESDVRGKATE